MFCDCPMVINYIPEINLTKCQKIKNGFVNLQKSYLIKIDVEETKNNLNDVSKQQNCDRRVLLFATAICLVNKHIEANKAVDCCQMLTQAISKYWYKQFYNLHISHIKPVQLFPLCLFSLYPSISTLHMDVHLIDIQAISLAQF